jgi:hypothetical protein
MFLRKGNESWLWHKRMGHMNFDNLSKINRKEAVKEMPKISKPTNTLYENCLQGKQIKTKVKSKEYLKTMLALRVTLRLQEDKPSTHQNVNVLKWFE